MRSINDAPLKIRRDGKIQDIYTMKNRVIFQLHSFLPGIGSLLLLLVLAGGCQMEGTTGPGNIIEGTFSGANGMNVEVELKKWMQGQEGKRGQFIAIDATHTDSNGHFKLEPQRPLPMDFYQIMVEKTKPMVVIMDSTKHLFIQATIPNAGYIADADISGFKAAQEASEYYSVAMPLQDRMSMMRVSMQQAQNVGQKQNLSNQSIELQSEISTWAKKFIEEHAGSPACLGPLEHLDIRPNLATFKEVLKSTSAALGGGAYHQVLSSVIQGEEAKMQAATNVRTIPTGNGANKPRPKKNSRYTVGDEAPEIVMNDPTGKPRKLSDLRGKVVLIDFWASWCGPCRRENPAVVRAYQQYQSKGFEIFSVSLDKEIGRWTNAIAQDQLEWPNHVCDLKGWSNAAARAYGVNSIPHTVLIDQEGTIVATHLRGGALVSQLQQLLP